MTNTKIEIIVESDTWDGKGLDLEIWCNKSLLWRQDNVVEKSTRIVFGVGLPMTLEFKVAGKSLDDTQVDVQGNILNDKFLKITHMSINDIWIKKWLLERKIFQSEFGSSNYFGHNGCYHFTIASTNLLDFWLDTMLVD